MQSFSVTTHFNLYHSNFKNIKIINIKSIITVILQWLLLTPKNKKCTNHLKCTQKIGVIESYYLYTNLPLSSKKTNIRSISFSVLILIFFSRNVNIHMTIIVIFWIVCKNRQYKKCEWRKQLHFCHYYALSGKPITMVWQVLAARHCPYDHGSLKPKNKILHHQCWYGNRWPSKKKFFYYIFLRKMF